MGHTHTSYAVESSLNMVAHESGQGPIELRLGLLVRADDKQRRMAGVITVDNLWASVVLCYALWG